MKLTSIKAILKKDILDGMKNYHVVLMVLTPLLLSLLFNKIILKGKSGEGSLPEIGFISSPTQPIIEKLMSKGMQRKINFYQDRPSLEEALLEGKVKFGLILPQLISSKSDKTITLLYPPSVPSFAADTIHSTFETMIREQLGLKAPELPFELKTEPVGGENKQNSTADNILPMLVLMSIGVIGFLALPMSIVEEREKGTLNAIFLTPISPSEFIIGKSLFSFGLIMLTVVLIITLNGKWNDNGLSILLISSLGAVITIFSGLIIAVFAQSQGSVNTMGTMLFLIFQIIPTLQYTSDTVKAAAPFIPSTYIFDGIKKALFMDLSKHGLHTEYTVLICSALVFYLIAYFVYKLKKADK